MINLSIIIPAFNEEKRIGATLLDYLTFFQDKNTEIIVVLNGCTDNTEKIVFDFQKKFPHILKYFNFLEPIGKGGAVLEGFKVADGKIIGFIDADRSTAAIDCQKLVEQLNNADGIIASRWLKNSIVENRSFFRRLASKCYAILVRLIFRMPLTDTQCGAKFFKKSILQKILPKLRETSMVFDVELLYFYIAKGYKLKEGETVWIDQPGSAALGTPYNFIKRGFQMLNKLLKIKKYVQESNL